MFELIIKKKQGQELSSSEIKWLIENFNLGIIPDYQMAAFLMAVCFQGMTQKETTDFTVEMMKSGTVLNLDNTFKCIVDKHSTGGVGDTTSLIVLPIVAAAGCTVAKMSGRGLGHTGGTLDKLESIPGLSVEISKEAFVKQLKKINIAIIGQTTELAPVDKKLYALRDVTGTIDSIPLIASSIMSKKLAAGAPTIILDVKVGRGAFMTTLEQAQELARTMVRIGKQLNRQVVAVLSNMDFPLGMAVGNSLEVIEAINILKGDYIPNLTELCLEISTQMLLASGKCESRVEAITLVNEMIKSKRALHTLADMVAMQGGNAEYIYDTSLFPKATNVIDIKASDSGYLTDINALEIGKIAMQLGAGRVTKQDEVDLYAGIKLKKHIGDFITKGEVLAELHVSKTIDVDEYQQLMNDAITVESVEPKKQVLVIDIIK